MNSIPASAFVSVNPEVIPAGGAGLALSGLFLTNSSLIPIGQVLSFASSTNVAGYFGASSNEAAQAAVYFSGFNNANIRPGQMLLAQYNQAAAPAWLRGGNISATPLTTLDALSGTLQLSVNGASKVSGSITLTSDSFSAAAAAIQSAFSAFSGTVTYSSITGAFTFTTTATGATETITTATSNYGTATACTSTGTVLTVGGTVVHTFSVGDFVVATDSTNSLPAGTYITSLGTGTGGAGTYNISAAGTPGDLTSCAATGYSVNGPLAIGLGLTTQTGAILSQGAAAASPGTFMAGVIATTTNWASFTTIFNPDVSGNTNKQAFAAWNTLQNNRYMYTAWDTDITPTESTNASTSLGQILIGNGNSGTALVYEPTDLSHASFIMGAVASIDFTEVNGNTSLAFKSQSGINPAVTNQTVMTNLIANGYNSYISAANANNQWQYLYPGSITGAFKSIQRYVNQIWLNSSFQTALMTLLTTVKAVPYVAAGYALIEAAMMDPINAALNFGMIQPGVALSSAEIAEVNYQAGANIAPTLQTRGWYLQVLDPGAVVRGGGGSPAISFWYTDGGSVLQINLASIDVM
jgi:hypothetical protein